MLKFLRRGKGDEKAKTDAAVKRTRASWFGRIRGVFQHSSLDESLWEELEEILISGDVGVETSLELVEGLRQQSRSGSLKEPEQVFAALKEELVALLTFGDRKDESTLPDNGDSPHVILVVGVNGVGKTTSIAKLAHALKQGGNQVLLGAADTFRAAAIDQLQIWGNRVGVDVVAHSQGADPGAVAYDSFQAAKARGADILIIDTAGRLHTKTNLMAEAKKIHTVVQRLDSSAPHEVLLALDATIGHNGLSQARAFTDALGCTGIFLAKLDGTARGGIALAVSRELGLPIHYIGTGEGVEDMAAFNPRQFVEALLAPVD